MRRADRLFQIIQVLRRATAPVTAQALADEMETSVRTIYRDIADLMAQRVPVRAIHHARGVDSAMRTSTVVAASFRVSQIGVKSNSMPGPYPPAGFLTMGAPGTS